VNKGVLYSLSGMKDAHLLLVSIASLREWYHGDVCIVSTDDCRNVCDEMSRDGRLGPVIVIMQRAFTKSHFILKLNAIADSPFRRTVFLDADTVVNADIEPLFIEQGIKVPWFHNIRIGDGHVLSTRAERRSEKLAKRSTYARWLCGLQKGAPLVNTGVLGVGEDSKYLLETAKSICRYAPKWVTDEDAVQLLTGSGFNLRITCSEWNVSARYCDSWSTWSNAKIKHFNNHSHTRWRGWIEYRKRITRLYERNIANVKEWFCPDRKRVIELLVEMRRTYA